jgi:membrane associated rhomboid family serine protease
LTLEIQQNVQHWKYGFCKTCKGRLFHFGLLPKYVVSIQVLRLVKAARESKSQSELRCPECKRKMRVADEVLACNPCQIFWIANFDSPTLPKVQSTEPETIKAWENQIVNFLQRIWNIDKIVPRLPTKGEPKTDLKGLHVADMIAIAFLVVPLIPYGTSNFNPPPMPPDLENHRIFRYSQTELDKFGKATSLGLAPSANFMVGSAFSAMFLHLYGFQVLLSALLFVAFGRRVEERAGSLVFALVILLSGMVGMYAANIQYQGQASLFLIGPGGMLAGLLGYYLGATVSDSKRSSYAQTLRVLALGAIIVFTYSRSTASLGGTTLSGDTGQAFSAITGFICAFIT